MMGTQAGYDPGNFYTWRASEEFSIHLSLNVVTRLVERISEAAETRGILLGRTIEVPFRATIVEDFQLVLPGEGAAPDRDSHDRESQDALVEIARRMAETGSQQRAIGFFRARPDGRLSLGQRDLETFSRLFGEPGNVALLIQTLRRGNESDAALFYWQNGRPQPHDFGFGFPLDALQLASGHPGWRYPDPLEHNLAYAPVPPLVESPQPVEAPPAAAMPTPQPLPPPKPRASERTPPPPFVPSAGNRIRWSRLLPTAALAILAVGAVQLTMNSKRTVAETPTQTETAASGTAPSVAAPIPAPISDENALALTVTPLPRQLDIRWNRESQAIKESKEGVMRITEDGITEALPLDQNQLRDGYVAYTPKTTDVSIRLEVTGTSGRTTSESVRSVAMP